MAGRTMKRFLRGTRLIQAAKNTCGTSQNARKISPAKPASTGPPPSRVTKSGGITLGLRIAAAMLNSTESAMKPTMLRC